MDRCVRFGTNWVLNKRLIMVCHSGGTAPFDLLLLPVSGSALRHIILCHNNCSLQVFGTQRTIAISNESFSDGKGNFKTQLPFPKDQKFLVSMADSTGLGSGGTSIELIVGPSLSDVPCNTTDPGASCCHAAHAWIP